MPDDLTPAPAPIRSTVERALGRADEVERTSQELAALAAAVSQQEAEWFRAHGTAAFDEVARAASHPAVWSQLALPRLPDSVLRRSERKRGIEYRCIAEAMTKWWPYQDGEHAGWKVDILALGSDGRVSVVAAERIVDYDTPTIRRLTGEDVGYLMPSGIFFGAKTRPFLADVWLDQFADPKHHPAAELPSALAHLAEQTQRAIETAERTNALQLGAIGASLKTLRAMRP